MSNQSGSITNPALGPTLQGFTQTTGGIGFFNAFLPRAVAVGFIIGSILFFIYLIWGSIDWIISSGDKQKLETAHGKITNAIVGLVVLFAAYAIIKVIQSLFGINILSLQIGQLAL